ncbi:ATP-binding cassette domain-containing protein [Salmonella enterica subsp. enterica]|nr:ATP-binding cassette domain-containing protein [Salmonella enterica subsp. enterica]
MGRSDRVNQLSPALITRFYDIDEGHILMDGHDLRRPLASLRNQVALVSQNVHLFNDTVANNIAYADGRIQPRAGEEAARIFMPWTSTRWIMARIPSSAKTAYFSGGQRQRIAIARLTARQPDFDP